MLILYHTGVILIYHIQYQRKNLTILNTGYRYSLSHEVLNGQLSKKKKKMKLESQSKVGNFTENFNLDSLSKL